MNNEKSHKNTIGIITYPSVSFYPNTIPLTNLVNILSGASYQLFIILGKNEYSIHKNNKKLNLFYVNNYKINNSLLRIFKEIIVQIIISYNIIKNCRKVKKWIFFVGGATLLLPMLTTKLLRQKVILDFPGSAIETHKSFNDPLVFGLKIQSKINCMLSDMIILYSKNLINEYDLEKWKNKIKFVHEHYLDFDKFMVKKAFNERDYLISYIGRLSEEKGVINLLNAIPQILKAKNDFKFIFIGEGNARDIIQQFLTDHKLNDKVKMEGWISHDELPDYLNESKLIIIPSYTEGLPNVMLEAMVCGTPVLATSVGSIPDLITDEETGFLMENNSPKCISLNIDRVFNHPDLVAIADNAKKLVKKDFTFEVAVERFTEILEEI